MQQNAAAARIRGAEVDVDWTPNRAWVLSAGLSYTHGRFTKFPGAAVYDIIGGGLTATAEDLTGAPLPNAPDFTANASISYNFDVTQGWTGDFTVAGRYTSKYDFSAGAGGELRAARQPAFGLVNLTANLYAPDDKLSVGWFVENLFDAKYISLISTGNTGVYMTPGVPRVFGGTVKYRF
jgi:iron complex outermembrane receptor protein